MSDGILLKHGNTLDDSELTAIPVKVRKNKSFIGSGGEEMIGIAEDILPETRLLPIGGNLPIKAGIHNGAGTVRQSVPTMGGVTVYPTNVPQTVQVGGKYMLGDIVTDPLVNLLPQYIKKGIIINGVKGTYEGYN